MDFKITVHIHRSHGLDMVLYSTTDDLHSGTVSTYLLFYSSDTVKLVLVPSFCIAYVSATVFDQSVESTEGDEARLHDVIRRT
jgi:hypothetical protein